MRPFVISLIAFAFMFGGTLLAMRFRTVLPKSHLSADSKDVVRLSMGIIGTMAALVLGLLIASAKSSYDTKSAQINQITANMIILDGLLEQYGPDALVVRRLLRSAVNPMVDRIWSEDNPKSAPTVAFEASAEGQALFDKIQELAPRNESQRSLHARVIRVSTDMAQARLSLFAQAGHSIPMPFLIILVFWLTIIFASFSLFVRANPIVVGALFVCTLSVSGAIFLILELGQPFSGVMAISSTPLRHVLAPLGL